MNWWDDENDQPQQQVAYKEPEKLRPNKRLKRNGYLSKSVMVYIIYQGGIEVSEIMEAIVGYGGSVIIEDWEVSVGQDESGRMEGVYEETPFEIIGFMTGPDMRIQVLE